ncbi:NAD(P)/FAD-dependent oxidoreductase [Caloramator sp. CAR-1]|uniref:NAD(P)/FAD-dependent oxidoreductase n=1 Tax=Caloramator sp. CAR-1 TaxID=3062777 RepID=UPI0026E29498|nr:NAD(P)/FAD-dependent oxidoreductase [Caloramator sp. CAR-1]MDO6354707.1 NAD(P)/FAD-dependent oxidoreductase [Caloramator sp. CAR-1]
MKVAIMGAGISGLSCAITLERYGIMPTIFEKRNRVGDRFINAEAMFEILNRPIKDCIPYIKEKFSIDLQPIKEVNKLTIHSKNEKSDIIGKIGYTNIRGRHENSFENQLKKQVKSNIIFNSKYEYEELCKEFDYIVIATGDGEYATHLGNYRCDLTCTIRGATVVGNFITDNPHVWFNYNIIPKGYAWLIPFSDKEANLVIAYPDYPNNIKLDINDMWEAFYNLACSELKQSLKITDRFEITRYMMGICIRPKIDNTYFIGNCFGTISPGLGFGQFASVLTGVYCAYDILGRAKYEILTKPLFKNYYNSLILRRFLEGLDDYEIDKLVRNLNNKLINKFVSKICGNNMRIDILKLSTPYMKLINRIKESKK